MTVWFDQYGYDEHFLLDDSLQNRNSLADTVYPSFEGPLLFDIIEKLFFYIYQDIFH